MNSATTPLLAPYENSADFLKDRMALLSLTLHREVMLTRALRGKERQESFLGLFISDDDITAILAELHGSIRQEFPEGDLLLKRIDTLTAAIARRLRQTQNLLPHQRLAAAFALQPQEVDLLLMALAPEMDQRFGKVYGFLHDDVARKRMSAGLAQQLLDGRDAAAEKMRRSLHPDSPLLKFRLLQLLDDDTQPLLMRALKLDNRVVNFLLDIHQIDEDLVEVMTPPWSARVTFTTDACTDSAVSAYAQWRERSLPLVLEVPALADVDVWLTLFCSQGDLGLLSLHWQKLAALEHAHAAKLLRKALREAHLTGCLLHVADVDSRQPRLLSLLLLMATALTCISSAQSLSLQDMPGSAITRKLPPLSVKNRLACWEAVVPFDAGLEHDLLQTYAERYPISVRIIDHLCKNLVDAGTVLAQRDAPGATFTESLRNACRQHVSSHMRDVAQRIESSFGFADLVLPPSTMVPLQELVARQANIATVFHDWGMGSVFRQSEGSAVLFVGPSGTGKTVTANAVANELGLDMYRVDLSGVVSKYIGETEKNLERIFAAAAQSQVVLFIDEADALFGKRSEVKDAHDRYANIEVSYLLQKMEEHKGVVILASNFSQNIDDAFFRRFSAVVEFNLPKPEDRLRLWQKLHQTDAPLADNVDLEFLAERFDITGGHIKNCMMAAAFHAAAEKEPISMQMLIRAISREYAKLGKPISRNTFGDYYSAVRRESNGN